jgi:predicted alpha-1,2-mannosidase
MMRARRLLPNANFLVYTLSFLLTSPLALANEQGSSPNSAIGLAEPTLSNTANGAKPTGVMQPVDFVNPLIGTSGVGHTYPGATVPFGMVQLSPDTGTTGWKWCSGYHFDDASIIGFSHTHLSGTGCSDLGDFLVVPLSGPLTTAKETKQVKRDSQQPDKSSETEPGADPNAKKNALQVPRLKFAHSNETASPGYYSVKLESGIKAELTATEHAGMHRYTFPTGKEATLIVDLGHGIGNFVLDSELNIVGDHIVTGFRRSRGWANDRPMFFAAEFSTPFSTWGTADEEKQAPQNRHAQGRSIKGWLTFPAQEGKPISLRVGVSTTSIQGALLNLHSEIHDFNFDSVQLQARQSWNKELSKLKVSTANESRQDLETFYTSLYHCFLAPTLISDVDGKYRGSDHEIHTAQGFRNYSTFSLWDTFRAEHPLLTLLTPGRVSEFIKAFEAHAQNMSNRGLPLWPLYSNETYCMIGYHSFPVIAEAYAKGLRDWDAQSLFQLMQENSKRNDYWAPRGYMASDCDLESVSKTLEFAYDDWALAQFAKDLGKTSDYEKFSKRASEYKNLFDKQTGFMRGRLANGTWHSPFDPGDFTNRSLDFTEGDAWQYTFFVPHDVQGLIGLFGSRQAFIDKLDGLFTAPYVTSENDDHDISGLIGQYAHGNEPSHHIAYLYDYAGQPWKTQAMVKRIRHQLYTNTPTGLCGNEDCGQMSAWYVFSALGFYPVNPVQGTYVFGVPAFHKCTLLTPSGKEFVIEAPNLSEENCYIKSVILNGKELSRVYLTHEELCAGGKVEFIMSAKPDSAWGTQADCAPIGMSSPSQ